MPVVWSGSKASGNRENTPATIPSADGEYSYGSSPPNIVGNVVMKGGTSGDDSNYLPNIDVAFNRAIPQNTAGGSAGSNIQLSQCTGNREGPANPPVPESGSPDDAAI